MQEFLVHILSRMKFVQDQESSLTLINFKNSLPIRLLCKIFNKLSESKFSVDTSSVRVNMTGDGTSHARAFI